MQTSIAHWLRKPAVVSQPADAVVPDPTCAPIQPAVSTVPVAISNEVVVQPAPAPAPQRLFDLCRQPPARPLPPQVTIEPIKADLIPSFRRLNSLLLPIPYQDKFFDETITDPVIASISRAALWSSGGAKPRLVAAIRCRLLSPQDPATGPALYISTVGTLAPYRTHGLATALLEAVVQVAISEYEISSVCVHAWAANEEGLGWYAKRGFTEVGREDGYYRRLNPSTAILLRRDVRIMDLLSQGNGPATPRG